MNKKIMERIVFLDYMRVIAFMSVVIGHEFFPYVIELATNSGYHITIRSLATALLPLFQGGAAGVVIFFLSSGYIITHVLQKETTLDFLIRRIFRIYPLYIFAVLMEALFATLSADTPLPSASILLSRLTLTGDFFGTPYALSGVEWTLRIEVLFYALMAALKLMGVFNRQSLLPWLYIALIALFMYGPVFPNFAIWSDGYLNLYAPFLLAGSCIYLLENKLASPLITCTTIALTFIAFCLLMPGLHPNWKESHFAILSILIFLASWHWRYSLKDKRVVRIASDLTYSVYLFHGWMWIYLSSALKETGLKGFMLDLAVLALLLVICYCITTTVERRGIEAGRWVVNRARRKNKFIQQLHNYSTGGVGQSGSAPVISTSFNAR